MRKALSITVFMVAMAFSAASVLADQVTGLTTFTSGTPAVAASVNANFSEIENSVNDNYARLSNIKILRDGVSTIFKGRISVPPNITNPDNIVVIVYLRGCDGSAIQMGHYWEEIQLGNNPNGIITWAYGNPVNMPVADPSSFVVGTYSFNVDIGFITLDFDPDSLLSFGIRREGANAADTCSSDVTLYGVKVSYPVTGGANITAWIPPSDLD